MVVSATVTVSHGSDLYGEAEKLPHLSGVMDGSLRVTERSRI